jgi:hypothetical protein
VLLKPATYPSKQFGHVARIPLSVSELAIMRASTSIPGDIRVFQE